MIKLNCIKIGYLTFLLLLVNPVFIYAQDGNCNQPINKKAKKQFEKLAKEYSLNNTETVVKIQELSEKYPDFVDAVYFLADHYKKATFNVPKPTMREKLAQKTIVYFEKSVAICPEFSGHLAYYHLGIFYHKYKNDLKTAAEYFQKYLDNEKEPPKSYKKIAQNLADEYFIKFRLLAQPVPYEPKTLQGVSSAEDEYLPMLSPDNNYLYYTRKRNTPLDLSQPLKNGNDNNENFSFSRKMSVDSFSFGRIMGSPFNDYDGMYEGKKLVGQGGMCLTPDNKTMYLTLTLLATGKDGFKNTQLYYSELKDEQWTALKPVGNQINDENGAPTWEGQPTISSDGKLMIFATARPSSTSFKFGEEDRSSMDLFMVQKISNNEWGVPKSLGPVINTMGNEKTPFLHTDSKTLYFSSNGHPGMGGYDIFYTQMDDNGNWRKPVNIGFPINTEKDEHGLMVSLDGKYAYMSSGEKGGKKGGLDIIHFPLHPEARPDKVVFVKGTIEDPNGDAIKNGKVQIKDELTGKVHEAIVDQETGEYIAAISIKDPAKKELAKETVILKIGDDEVEVEYGSKIEKVNGKEQVIAPGAEVITIKNKQFVLNKGDLVRKVNGEPAIVPKGHEVVEQNNKQIIIPKKIDLSAAKEHNFLITATGNNLAFNTESLVLKESEFEKPKTVSGQKIKIQKINKGEAIRLNEVNFTTNSNVLNTTSMAVLDKLVDFLNAMPTMKIAIHGHTDDKGDAMDNLKLSQRRAKEVMDYLIYNGIDAKRLNYNGFGSSEPKVTNKTEKDRAINRRVEFIILGM